jgi:hypothetical protein
VPVLSKCRKITHSDISRLDGTHHISVNFEEYNGLDCVALSAVGISHLLPCNKLFSGVTCDLCDNLVC